MPKKLNQNSSNEDGLKVYKFHGLDIDELEKEKEVVTHCPFCTKSDKFSIDKKTTKWRCFSCGENGNAKTFLRKLWEAGKEEENDYTELAKSRGLLKTTLEAWGVVQSPITGEWLIPGFDVKGEVTQLYRWVLLKGKHKLLATPTFKHGIHGLDNYNKNKPVVFLCEGPWDGMKLWETLATTSEKEGVYTKTKSKKTNLLKNINVLAVPGCSTFNDSWNYVFLNKKVYIVYDNDHPKKHPKTGKTLKSAGAEGMKRVTGLLGEKPKQIKWLNWGEEGYNLDIPDNTDIRDLLEEGRTKLEFIFTHLEEVPKEWKTGKGKAKKAIALKDCDKWEDLLSAWRSAMMWTEGLDISLSVMLASAVSTDLPGDQLWVKIIGPASCGKSTLCEAVSVNKNFVLAKSTIRGFHSGFKTDRGGDEDNSLLVQAAGKSLVTKDGDTLLQSPNLSQILSEARDVYDKTSRTHYRNTMSKEYTGINMTWILCGTSSLRSIDSSELGERFLDCMIMENIDDDMEDQVLMQVVQREDHNISNGRGDDDKNMLLAMSLTGGYVQYLRTNAVALMAEVSTPRPFLQLLTRIGKFVSFMRARPSKMQSENAEREFAARLVSQHLRLAKCLSVVLNRKEVDEEVMRRTVKVALDTSRGVTLDLCMLLYDNYEEEGGETKSMAAVANQSDYLTLRLLTFLKAIGVVKQVLVKRNRMKPKKRWALTDKTRKLFDEVLGWRNND